MTTPCDRCAKLEAALREAKERADKPRVSALRKVGR